jgi:hypothetical protein
MCRVRQLKGEAFGLAPDLGYLPLTEPLLANYLESDEV